MSDQQKKDFLNYDIAVRNLGIVTREEIIEIFRRINSTNYALNDMEVNNAMYAGKFNIFCQKLADLEFFERQAFFRPMQLRRMGDVKYVASIVITMIGGYFNRDDLLEEYLQRYNDVFAEEKVLRGRFLSCLKCIEEMEFDSKSRVWKQADFFTLGCEIDNLTHNKKQKIDAQKTKRNLDRFYELVDSDLTEHSGRQQDLIDAQAYADAIIQAVNDRTTRIMRAKIIREKITTLKPARRT
jgi:hypothetical protein